MRRAVPGILAFLGLALVMAGIAVFAAANHASVPDFGWTSYAPLEPQVPGPFDTSTYAYAPDWTVLWTAGHPAAGRVLPADAGPVAPACRGRNPVEPNRRCPGTAPGQNFG